jgi:transcription elongation factor GreA
MELKKIMDQLKVELTQLDVELRIQLPKEIDTARRHGDLKENAEYHAAKARQSFVQARIEQLQVRISELSRIDLDRLPEDRVGLFSTVTLVDLRTEDEVEYTLVTNEEADFKKGLISLGSPLGKGLVGRGVGDEVKIDTPGGRKEFEILTILTLHQKNKG